MEIENKCSNCGINNCFIYQKIDAKFIWGLCFDCMKEKFQKVIGEPIEDKHHFMKKRGIIEEYNMEKETCFYCDKNHFLLKYIKNDSGIEIIWAVCLSHFKKFFDVKLGNAKEGGWMEKSPNLIIVNTNIELNTPFDPAIKCSYCQKIVKNDEKYNMGFESEKWAVCADCTKRALS